jgi:RimJ/RimL family protein N-acetyltransferase
MTLASAKPVPPSHEFEGVVLRPLQVEQLPLTLAWRNRDGVRQRFLNSDVVAPEAHQSWYQRYLEKADDVVLLAYEAGERQPFGQVAIYAIDFPAGEAEVGRFVVAPEHERQGKMRRAVAALLHLASTKLGLRSVKLEVLRDNARAIRIYESLGFLETSRSERIVEMRLTF